MGRHCGWLTAATARAYIQKTAANEYIDGFMMNAEMKSIDGLYLPEMAFDIEAEGERLRSIMEKTGQVTLFVSEGAALDAIVAEREAAGESIKRDAFGHVKIDTINVGGWFQKQFASIIGAERSMVQKSGYFARSAPANGEDLRLIQGMVDLAVENALNKVSGVTGHDEGQGGKLRVIEFPRIKGGKAFDLSQPWFADVMDHIGQKYTQA
jgi:pyrophosphate--fructose-6-phosphate 1-phosphotransferase